MIHFSLTAVHCFGDGYMGKQPVAWKEYCAEYMIDSFTPILQITHTFPFVNKINKKFSIEKVIRKPHRLTCELLYISKTFKGD